MAVTKSEQPHDRLTRLCAAMTAAMEQHPEARGDEKVAVLIQDSERGGIQLHGYEDVTEAAVDLFMHLRALFQANGQDLSIIPLDAKGRG